MFSGPDKRGDYPAEQETCIDIDTLTHLITKWIVEIYHQTPHRGIGTTPLAEWLKGAAVRLIEHPAEPEQLGIILSHMKERTVFHYGVEIHGLLYNGPHLQDLRKRHGNSPKIKCKINIDDLGYLHYFDPDQRAYLCRVREGNLLSSKEQIFGAPIPHVKTIVALLGMVHERELTKPLLRQLAQEGASANPLWNHKTARFCPTCLEEERLWRREWELSLYTCCHKHGHQLHDCCPRCVIPITWRRDRLLECDCGVRFASSIPVDAGAGERWLANRLAVLSRKQRGLDEGHLQLLGLEELHRVAVFLGAYGRTSVGNCNS